MKTKKIKKRIQLLKDEAVLLHKEREMFPKFNITDPNFVVGYSDTGIAAKYGERMSIDFKFNWFPKRFKKEFAKGVASTFKNNDGFHPSLFTRKEWNMYMCKLVSTEIVLFESLLLAKEGGANGSV